MKHALYSLLTAAALACCSAVTLMAQNAALVKDILPGSTGRFSSITMMNNVLYFSADDGVNGIELWRSDGTTSGTWMVKNINPGGDSGPLQITDCNGTLYMSANDGKNGYEPWISNGTVAGTVMLKDIFPKSEGSSPRPFHYFNGYTYFAAAPSLIKVQGAPMHTFLQYELHKSDGTSAGTVLLKDLNPKNKEGSFPYSFIAFRNRLHFIAAENNYGFERYSSDGTAAGTYRILDLKPGSDDGVYNNESWKDRVIFNDYLYFTGNNGSTGFELFKTDGTAAGTTLVKDIYPGPDVSSDMMLRPQYMTVCNGQIYFAQSDGIHGNELWRSDGTAAGTYMVADINPAGSSLPANLTAVGNTLYFSADDGVNGREVWKLAPSANPAMVKDIYAGAAGSNPNYGNNQAPYSLNTFREFLVIGEYVYFTADDGAHGYELWRTDGTDPGTGMVVDINTGAGSSLIRYPVVMNGKLHFFADDGVHGHELWTYSPPVPKNGSGSITDAGAGRFELSQNYPNPFNPCTSISFTIPEKMRLRLSVCDMLSRYIAVPAEGEFDAGTHTVYFNAAGLPSGLYVCRLETPVGTMQRSMHLVK